MPERTCICCRIKAEKDFFFRISKKEDKYVFDENMKIQDRGIYICRNIKCIEKLSKNRKYDVSPEELTKMLKKLEKEKKNIIDIIRAMKNSEFFVFGIEENIENIKKNKVKLIILPGDIKPKYITQFLNLKEEYKVKVINIEKKEALFNVFSKNVNVVGIGSKKVADGILAKVEVTE